MRPALLYHCLYSTIKWLQDCFDLRVHARAANDNWSPETAA